jgi:Kef-type K+ transport system membrane component KefB
LKLLTDKGDVNKLYGRVSIGILLVQDLVATITLVVITGLSNVQNSSVFEIGYKLGNLLIIGFILLVTLFLITTQILSRLTNFVSKSSEFLFMFSLAWGLSISYLYQILGLSLEIGALIAGVTLSMTPYSYEISSRLKPLRDFFILMFFILLGSQMVFENTASLVYPIIIFSLFVLFIKPILVLITMNLLGYNKKNGFLTGLAIAQISEFSLILVKIGNEMGHISTEVQSLITIVGVISIAGSSYLIVFNESIFKHLSKLLSIFEFRKNFKRETKLPKDITGVIFPLL